MFIVYLFRSCRDKEQIMSVILANIIATGDSGKPLLVAICLIVSIVLMVVLIMTGKSNADSEEKQNIEDNRKKKNNNRSRKG